MRTGTRFFTLAIAVAFSLGSLTNAFGCSNHPPGGGQSAGGASGGQAASASTSSTTTTSSGSTQVRNAVAPASSSWSFNDEVFNLNAPAQPNDGSRTRRTR